MKLTEVKQLKEDYHRAKLKEMFPEASDAIIEEGVRIAEIKGLGTAAKFVGNTFKKGADLAVKGGKQAVDLAKKTGKAAAPIVKKVGQQTANVAKNVATKTKQGVQSVGRDIKKGYQNVKAVGADAVKTAQKGMAQMRKDMDGAGERGSDMNQPDQKTTANLRRLKGVTGMAQPQIAAMALKRAAAGRVLKQNERNAIAPLLQSLAGAMEDGTNIQRIINIIKASK